MKAKIIVITGATSGIGRIAALKIAETGATILYTYRDKIKSDRLLKEILTLYPKANVDPIYCDMSDLGSVKKTSDYIQEKYNVVDVLLNNAGIWETTFGTSINGIELNLAVNHLAPFLLTTQLMPLLQKSASARVINTSSIAAHYINGINFEDVEFRTNFDAYSAYRQSKLANIMFTLSLNEMYAVQYPNISYNVLHPGVVETNLFQNFGQAEQSAIAQKQISVEEGAQTSIYLAISPEVEGVSGGYFYKCQRQTIPQAALTSTNRQKLWDLSEKYIQQFF